MDFFDGPHYRINKVLLSVIGQWPSQTALRRRITLAILFLLAGTQFMAKMFGMITSYNDVDVILENLSPFFVDVCSIIKIVNSTLKMKKMRILIDRIEADFVSYRKTTEVQFLNAFARDGKKFTIIYGGLLYVATIVFMISPLKPLLFENFNSTSERPLIHHTEYFVNTEPYYYFLILHSEITIFICILTIVTMDTMLLVLIQHACGLFATLRYQLESVTDNQSLDMNMKPPIEDDKPYRSISECVRRHKKAIEFADLMKSYYSTSFFLQTGLNMIGISFAGLQAVINMDNTEIFFQQVAFSYGALAHMFFECINGQRLMDYSDQMHEHLINMKWYLTSIRTRKVINLMLLRSKVPCKMTAANVLVISMESFSAIVRTSMSYFTVLHSMQ